MDPILLVFVYALITAIATGVGALPFFITRNIPKKMMGLANGAAAGLMTAASFNLIYEGLEDVVMLTGGMLAGLLFILASEKFLKKHGELRFPHKDQIQGQKMLLIMAVMTLHSFTEGVGVGVSFGRGESFGAFISAAIALHNVPEGLAISLILVPRGISALKAAGWSVFSSLPQPLMAVPAFLFVEQFAAFLPVGLGFAAGAMLWMVVAEILPESCEDAEPSHVGVVMTLSIIAMLLFQVWLA